MFRSNAFAFFKYGSLQGYRVYKKENYRLIEHFTISSYLGESSSRMPLQ